MIINSIVIYTKEVDMITLGADCIEEVLGSMTRKPLKMFNLHLQGIIVTRGIIQITR